MTLSQRIEAGKPYLTGFILGIVAAPIIGFGAGWVSTAGARDEAVQNARVDAFAYVCSQAAQTAMASSNTAAEGLKGWGNRVKREELVTSTMATLTVPDDLTKRVTTACDKTLA